MDEENDIQGDYSNVSIKESFFKNAEVCPLRETLRNRLSTNIDTCRGYNIVKIS